MNREIAVIGLGRFGSSVALALSRAGHTVVGVDVDRDVVQELADELTDVICADATDEQALRLMGISDFDTVVVAIGDFESNLLTTASLKQFGVAHVIAKALTGRQAAILNKIGVDQVILPEQEAGERLALHLVSSVAARVLDETGLSVGERSVPPEWIGRSLGELAVRSKLGVLAVAIRRGSELMAAPGGGDRFEVEDHIMFIGPPERLKELGCRLTERRT